MINTVIAQLPATDLFIVNKIDLISEKQVAEISWWLRLQNKKTHR